MQPLITPRSEHPISRRQLDPDALKVLYRLNQVGRIAYLVGGGVRDLLVGLQPKDFDVVTDAHPGEVKRLFRNAWIIGRRFKLVHVVFGRKVVEVATFRRKSEPQEEEGVTPAEGGGGPAAGSLLVTRENTFGTPEEDALRRDFTINALFYDIGTYALIDYVGGLEDLRQRLIRTIGDPDIRFQEDPVRMLRAVKFAARLDFRIDPLTFEAMRRHAGAITLSAPARVIEELYRLLGSGRAATSFRLLHETGLLPHLVPEASAILDKDPGLFWRSLEELDRLVIAGPEPVSRAVQMGALLIHPVRDLVLGTRPAPDGLAEEVEALLRPVTQRLRITRAETARLIQIVVAQKRLVARHGRRFSVGGFTRRAYFADALLLLRIQAAASGELGEAVRRWTDRGRELAAAPPTAGDPDAPPDARPRPRRRRSRRRRR
jgi:poly(A) polymerase